MFTPEENKHICDISNLMDSSIPRSERMTLIINFLSTFQPGAVKNRPRDEHAFRRLLHDLMMAPNQMTLFHHFLHFTTFHTMDKEELRWLADALEINFFRTQAAVIKPVAGDAKPLATSTPSLSIERLLGDIFTGGAAVMRDYVSGSKRAGLDSLTPPISAPKMMRHGDEWICEEEKLNLDKALTISAEEAGVEPPQPAVTQGDGEHDRLAQMYAEFPTFDWLWDD